MTNNSEKKGSPPSPPENSEFNAPSLAINRVYTKKGDAGETRLVGGQKVSKYHDRIEAYGTLDELNACVGMSVEELKVEESEDLRKDLVETLIRVQHQLFNLGSILATLPEDVVEKMPRVTEVDVEWLEEEIDKYTSTLTPLRSFVLPGGTKSAAHLHLCRTVCRRAERLMVKLSVEEPIEPVAIAYINRLSDAFFVWSRVAVVESGAEELLWEPWRARSCD